jgi:hypothetical protein
MTAATVPDESDPEIAPGKSAKKAKAAPPPPPQAEPDDDHDTVEGDDDDDDDEQDGEHERRATPPPPPPPPPPAVQNPKIKPNKPKAKVAAAPPATPKDTKPEEPASAPKTKVPRKPAEGEPKAPRVAPQPTKPRDDKKPSGKNKGVVTAPAAPSRVPRVVAVAAAAAAAAAPPTMEDLASRVGDIQQALGSHREDSAELRSTTTLFGSRLAANERETAANRDALQHLSVQMDLIQQALVRAGVSMADGQPLTTTVSRIVEGGRDVAALKKRRTDEEHSVSSRPSKIRRTDKD